MRLVLLNGWAASSAMLERFKSYLPDSYDLIILDDLYQYELADIKGFIEKQITPETVLIGWSLGGMLALDYVIESASNKRPKALICLNSSVCFLERSDFSEGLKRVDFDGLKLIVQAQNTNELLRLFGHLLVEGSVCYKKDRRLLMQLFNSDTLPSWAALTKGLKYLESLDLRQRLGLTLQSTLFLLGENDVLISASSKHKLLDENIKVDVLPGMGHFPFGDFSQEIAAKVISYIDSLSEN